MITIFKKMTFFLHYIYMYGYQSTFSVFFFCLKKWKTFACYTFIHAYIHICIYVCCVDVWLSRDFEEMASVLR